MVLSDLSDTVYDALNDALPDSHSVWRVEVFEGWARIPFVTVYSGMSRSEAGAALAEKIHMVVAGSWMGAATMSGSSGRCRPEFNTSQGR